MRIFEIVKENVNLREAAELYGIDVNRYGKALCPFHNDRNPSLYVADDHYYCFACGEHGDVIDFVGRLFQLSPYDAARKLMADFHLSGCAFLFCPITPVCCGTGRCGMRRNLLTSLFPHGSWKPVTSSMKRNIT